MATEREIEALLEEVGSTGRVVETDVVSPEGGQLTTVDADALVTGDVLPGGVAESDRSLIVTGTACGQEGSPCRLRAAGRLIVCGEVVQAQLSAPHLRFGASVERAQVAAKSQVTIGGNLVASQLVVGEFRAEESRLRTLRQDVESRMETHENLRSQVKFVARKVLKESRNTQVGFNLGLGNILQVRQRSVEVNLAPLYRLLDDRCEQHRTEAVAEFFDRVIVGLLTKANKAYIAKNRGREQVFLKVLKELRQLFDMVRQLDVMDEATQSAEREAAHILDGLRAAPDLSVCVAGQLHAGVEVEFVGARVADGGDGGVDIDRVSARLRVRDGDDEEHLAVEVSDFDGHRSEEILTVQELSGVALVLSEGTVSLDHMAESSGDSTRQVEKAVA